MITKIKINLQTIMLTTNPTIAKGLEKRELLFVLSQASFC
jgi:hypothetical protein